MTHDRRHITVEDPVVLQLLIDGDDHEVRLRGMERFKYQAQGAIAVLAITFPATVGVVVAILK